MRRGLERRAALRLYKRWFGGSEFDVHGCSSV
jgi:hypothetical protein